jgi:uncharacterized membrane protein YdbT with pleckstrin-like domain
MKSKKDTSVIWKDRKRILGMPISFTRYSIKNNRLYLSTGLFSIEENELLLYRILDIKLQKRFIDRILGIGTITLYTVDETNRKLVLKNIKYPQKVRDIISELVEKEKERLNITGKELIGVSDNEV